MAMAAAADNDDNKVDDNGATGDCDSDGVTGDYDDAQRQLRRRWRWRRRRRDGQRR